MKDTSKEKRIILGSKGNKECIYYISLFGVALAAALGLLIFSILKNNSGLLIYSCILLPIFALSLVTSITVLVNSINPISLIGDKLCIKRALYSKKIPLSQIDKIAVSTDGKSDISTVKVIYGKKSATYKFKNVSKETASVLRKLKK